MKFIYVLLIIAVPISIFTFFSNSKPDHIDLFTYIIFIYLLNFICIIMLIMLIITISILASNNNVKHR